MTRLLIPIAAALAVTLPATPAEACGGTFCDAGPQQMPVDQSGENILFVIDDNQVEAHVQIQYEGDPEKFAWVVPVMAMPEIETGSDPLFDNLLAATVPTFVLNTRFDDCEDGRGGWMPCAFSPARDEAAAGDGGGWGDDNLDDGTPDIVDVGAAGAFEYAVLSGGTIEGVVQWLDDNEYAQDDEAPPILEEYLDDGFMFVAFKLRSGADTDEIHPVVIRYEGTEPCVPIRLTRIAATDDMGIRAFFLGEHRVAPTNYRAVQINPLMVDWVNLGANYEQLVTLAVDGRGSDGHGFVTEYAGPSSIVMSEGLLNPGWDASKFLDIDPLLVVRELVVQALMSCSGNMCTFQHPLVQGVLEKYLPRPAGASAEAFYGCLQCWEDEIDYDAWDAAAFAAELEERIIGPAEHAVDLLASYPYLTRLYTTISPQEMTEDPLFHENPDLQDVDNTLTATRVFTCEGPDYIELDDGRRMALDPNGDLPDAMPWAAAIEEVGPAGAPMLLVDEQDAIEDSREAWNAEQGLADEGGCNCRSSRRDIEGAVWMAFILGVLGISRRRRR